MMRSSLLAFVALAVSGCAEAATYSRTASLSGQSFIDAFGWFAAADPTHGRVNYVDQSTAQSAGLYTVSGNSVKLQADDTTVLNPAGPGRNSFRLQSYAAYGNHVALFDIAHMPQGCGTWPALWFVSSFISRRFTNAAPTLPWLFIGCEVGPNWPYGGEIDIIEGINDQVPNQSTLHTGANCAMPDNRPMTGTATQNNCDVYSTGNAGCGVRISDWNSYGPNFNDNGGGWYAFERSDTYLAIYFWQRGSSSVPDQVRNPGGTVDTSTWGTPAAYFPNTDCDFSSHLGQMNIIINLTFCGDWAGSAYSASGCPSTCNDYVDNNPWAFSNAYFEFNSLNIYQ